MSAKYLYRVKLSNFMGLDALNVEFGKITKVSGPNTSGKTSLLKAIESGLIASGQQPHLVNIYATSPEGKPEPKAEIFLDLGKLQVRRSFTRGGGNYPKVKYYDEGTEMWLDEDKNVQTYLKGLVDSTLIFNPVSFVLCDDKQRRDLILQALPIRVTPDDLKASFGETHLGPINCERHGLEVVAEVLDVINTKRTAVGRERDDRKATWEKMVLPEGFRDEGPRDTAALMASVESAGALKERKAQLEREAGEADNTASRYQEQISRLDEQIASLRQQIAKAEADMQELGEHRQEAIKLAAAKREEAANVIIPSVEEAQATLRVNADYEANRRLAADKDAAEKLYKKAESIYDELDGLSKLAQSMPTKLLSETEMPVKGLTIEIGEMLRGKPTFEIRWNGRLLDDLSGAERMLLGLDVARACSGDLKIILVDGIEALDAASYGVLYEQMQSDDFGYIVNEVADWYGCGSCDWEGKYPAWPEMQEEDDDAEVELEQDLGPHCPKCGGPVAIKKHLEIITEGELPETRPGAEGQTSLDLT